MEQPSLDAQKTYWNAVFACNPPPAAPYSHWLEELFTQAALSLRGDVLEIGCGRGADTRYLLQRGCRVTSLDLSENALGLVRRACPTVQLVDAALPDPLPFRSAAFAYVVAGLSLHYFRWRDTRRIIQEIGRVLQPGGALLFQVNSVEDTAHGAGQGDEIEPHLFLAQGRTKRFFTEAMCRELFDSAWELEVLLPRVETRFNAPKPTWAGISRIISSPQKIGEWRISE